MLDSINGDMEQVSPQSEKNRDNLATGDIITSNTAKDFSRTAFAWTTGIIQAASADGTIDNHLDKQTLALTPAYEISEPPFDKNRHILLNTTTYCVSCAPSAGLIVINTGLIKFSVGNQGCFLLSRVDDKVIGMQYFPPGYTSVGPFVINHHSPPRPYTQKYVSAMAVSPCRPVYKKKGDPTYTSRAAYIMNSGSSPYPIVIYYSHIYASNIHMPVRSARPIIFGNTTTSHDMAYYFNIYASTNDFTAFIDTTILSVDGSCSIRYVVNVTKVPDGHTHVLGSHIFYQGVAINVTTGGTISPSAPFDREYNPNSPSTRYNAIGYVPGSNGTPAITQLVSGEVHTVALQSGKILQNNSILPGGQRYSAPDERTESDVYSDYSWNPTEPRTVKKFIPQSTSGKYYTQISAGSNHSCAVSSDGNISCWGRNSEGQSEVPQLPPTPVADGGGSHQPYFSQVNAFCNCTAAIVNYANSARGGMVVQWGDCPAELPCIIKHENCLVAIKPSECSDDDECNEDECGGAGQASCNCHQDGGDLNDGMGGVDSKCDDGTGEDECKDYDQAKCDEVEAGDGCDSKDRGCCNSGKQCEDSSTSSSNSEGCGPKDEDGDYGGGDGCSSDRRGETGSPLTLIGQYNFFTLNITGINYE